MRTIMNLFGRSPFAPLQAHMEVVNETVQLLKPLFSAVKKGTEEEITQLVETISRLEHRADLAKNDIRNHLPKSLFLPIDRSHLLEILSIQDHIADQAEDIAVLFTLKSCQLPEEFSYDFEEFLNKNIEAYDKVRAIMKEFNELLESSFGGAEAEKVCAMVEEVAYTEHEADLVQRRLLKRLFNVDKTMDFTAFYFWHKVFFAVAAISNLSEKLANRVRMTLELK